MSTTFQPINLPVTKLDDNRWQNVAVSGIFFHNIINKHILPVWRLYTDYMGVNYKTPPSFNRPTITPDDWDGETHILEMEEEFHVIDQITRSLFYAPIPYALMRMLPCRNILHIGETLTPRSFIELNNPISIYPMTPNWAIGNFYPFIHKALKVSEEEQKISIAVPRHRTNHIWFKMYKSAELKTLSCNRTYKVGSETWKLQVPEEKFDAVFLNSIEREDGRTAEYDVSDIRKDLSEYITEDALIIDHVQTGWHGWGHGDWEDANLDRISGNQIDMSKHAQMISNYYWKYTEDYLTSHGIETDDFVLYVNTCQENQLNNLDKVINYCFRVYE